MTLPASETREQTIRRLETERREMAERHAAERATLEAKVEAAKREAEMTAGRRAAERFVHGDGNEPDSIRIGDSWLNILKPRAPHVQMKLWREKFIGEVATVVDTALTADRAARAAEAVPVPEGLETPRDFVSRLAGLRVPELVNAVVERDQRWQQNLARAPEAELAPEGLETAEKVADELCDSWGWTKGGSAWKRIAVRVARAVGVRVARAVAEAKAAERRAILKEVEEWKVDGMDNEIYRVRNDVVSGIARVIRARKD